MNIQRLRDVVEGKGILSFDEAMAWSYMLMPAQTDFWAQREERQKLEQDSRENAGPGNGTESEEVFVNSSPGEHTIDDDNQYLFYRLKKALDDCADPNDFNSDKIMNLAEKLDMTHDEAKDVLHMLSTCVQRNLIMPCLEQCDGNGNDLSVTVLSQQNETDILCSDRAMPQSLREKALKQTLLDNFRSHKEKDGPEPAVKIIRYKAVPFGPTKAQRN